MQPILDALPIIAAVVGTLAGLVAIVTFLSKEAPEIWARVRHPRTPRENLTIRPAGVEPVDYATQKLAEAVTDHWEKQAFGLGLISRAGDAGTPATPANVMRIAWSVDARRTSKGLTAATQERLDLWRRKAESPLSAGQPGVHDLAAFFREVQPQVLVVLGSAESGKSVAALLLTLGLLQSRDKDDAVPVPFSLHHWDPGLQFEDWLAQRLQEDHSFLRASREYGPDAAGTLLAKHKVLPILDGLDELPEPGEVNEPGALSAAGIDAPSPGPRSEAIKAIQESDLPLPGLVLTCQQGEYEKVEVHARLAGAVVVTLAGVTPEEARRYLEFSESEVFIDRWQPVFDKLSEDEDGALATVLRSPLMTFLVSKVYHHGRSTPGELVDLDAPSIRKKLLTEFIPAVFSRTESTNAKRWLGNLALLMGDRPVIGWWELSAVGRPATQVMAGVVAFVTGSAAVGIAFSVLFNPIVGIVVGLVAGLLLGIASAMNEPPKPSEIQVRFGGRIKAILKSGLAIGVIVFFFGTVVRDVVFGLIAGVGFGLAIGVLYGVTTEPDPTARPVEPRFLLRRDLKVGVTFGLAYGLPAGIVGWWLSGSVVAGVLVGVSAALAGALLYGPIWTLQGSKIGVVAFVHLWLATIRFASRGRLPWRTLAFLDQAQQKGLIRLSSGKYQFRHPALQEVLAAESRRGSASPGREIAEPAHPTPDPVTTP